MTLIARPVVRESSTADRRAHENFDRNYLTLQQLQPELASSVRETMVDATPIFGRDGSLTAMTTDGRWWAGNSLPTLSAKAMLKTLQAAGGTVSCFLAPSLGAQVRVALDLLEPQQAIIVIQPDIAALRVALASEDFSADIAAHRLWWVCGSNWAEELSQLLQHHPGLPVPARFIKLVDLNAARADEMLAQAQPVLQSEISRRSATLCSPPASRRTRSAKLRLCIVAGTAFRLWDDAGHVLASSLTQNVPDDCETVLVNSDDPLRASPLALREAAAGCDAVIAANLSRADAPPQLVAREQPWITWITTGKIPAHASAGPADHLLLADAQWLTPAQHAGWPRERLHVMGWPELRLHPNPSAGTSLIANVTDLVAPAAVDEYSSHRLLWEAIREELLRDPSSIGTDIASYLSTRMRRMSISDAGFDHGLFIASLILPAYHIGLARSLVRKSQPLQLFGQGWDGLKDLSCHHRGVIRTREDFLSAVEMSNAIVNPFPFDHLTQVHATGKRIIGSTPRSRPGTALNLAQVLDLLR